MVAVALIPPRGLIGYAAHSDMHMVLATPTCFTNEEYVEYYQNTKTFKVLDNGTNEGTPTLPDQLFKYAYGIDAHEIILPDVMGNRDRTINAIDRCIEMYPMETKRFQCMAVIHAPTKRQALNTAKYMDDHEQVTTLGIPRSYAAEMNQRGARIELANSIQGQCPGRFQIHFLGAIPPWPTEVKAIAKYAPFVRSIDTSMPFNFTIARLGLADYSHRCIERPKDYFTRDYGGISHKLMLENIRTFKGWARGE